MDEYLQKWKLQVLSEVPEPASQASRTRSPADHNELPSELLKADDENSFKKF